MWAVGEHPSDGQSALIHVPRMCEEDSSYAQGLLVLQGSSNFDQLLPQLRRGEEMHRHSLHQVSSEPGKHPIASITLRATLLGKTVPWQSGLLDQHCALPAFTWYACCRTG